MKDTSAAPGVGGKLMGGFNHRSDDDIITGMFDMEIER